MNNILIATECVADLPEELYKDKDVAVIYYDIKTDGGLFRDTTEIDAQNVMEYMVGGHKKAYSVVPTANDYKNFFNMKLVEYDKIIHICISSGISEAYKNAQLARAKMGQDGNKIFLIDSRHLSSGQGLVTLEAVKCRDAGMDCKEIAEHLHKYVAGVSTTFLTNNADYLYYNGKVEKSVMDICNALRLHPVLGMVDGKLTVKKVYIGDYNKAAKKYIKSILGNTDDIDKSCAFITYAGCPGEILDMAQNSVEEILKFDELYRQQASATVSCNCGPKTFGILFVRNK